MNILCKMGMHKWQNCKCGRCGTVRDENHDFVHCKCSVCGKVRNQGHRYIGCRCTVCGKVRDEGHWYREGICAACGKAIPIDPTALSEGDRAIAVFDQKFSRAARMEALDSVPVQAAVSVLQSPPKTYSDGTNVSCCRTDEVAEALVSRLPEETLKELFTAGHWIAARKIRDTEFLIGAIRQAVAEDNSRFVPVTKILVSLGEREKAVCCEALLRCEEEKLRRGACLALGGHQRDEHCLCTRCGIVDHDWETVRKYYDTGSEELRCRRCGATDYIQGLD